MNITAGNVVTFEYVLLDGDGAHLDSSDISGPMTYVHGEGRIVPGLERALTGRAEGESFHLVVPPEDAYGWHDPERVEMVPKTVLDPSGEIDVGMRFESRTPQGIVIATVVALEGNEARIDSNHPLAGSELHFEVRVVSVREAAADHVEH